MFESKQWERNGVLSSAILNCFFSVTAADAFATLIQLFDCVLSSYLADCERNGIGSDGLLCSCCHNIEGKSNMSTCCNNKNVFSIT